MFRREIQIVGAILFVIPFILLNHLTSLGGLVLLGVVVLAWGLYRTGTSLPMAFLAGTAFFLAGLPIANLALTPILAQVVGRAALPCEPTADKPYGALTPLYCALGRNYARPRVEVMLEAMARDLNRAYPGLTVAILDANPLFRLSGGRHSSGPTTTEPG